ncbi:MAG TPA: chorismate synthase [Vicinamibacterales bacterium]|nr:chorismate synthase [Vicinamibacterales bacterium]
MLRFLTAGESHGQGLVIIVEGLPSGLRVDVDAMTSDLRQRQGGYGRGRRMAIESDRAEILGGVRRGRTTGAPVAILIRNRDWTNWQATMHVEPEAPEGSTGAKRAAVIRPRPGHADLAGALKYELDDIRDVLERASARETAARVAAGALARQLLAAVGVEVASHVLRIGEAGLTDTAPVAFERVRAIPAESQLRCVDPAAEAAMIAVIDAAKAAGDTVGGAFEVVAHGVPAGLGSHVHWDRKLDGRLAQAVMSIHAIKAVAIGEGVEGAHRPGSRVHDEIVMQAQPDGSARLVRPTNRAGGLEGGVTTGEDVRVTGYMKPISTLMKPLRSVDLTSLEEAPAAIERSDVCAVPAAAVVGEAMVAWVLAGALVERFGGDSVRQLRAHVEDATARIDARLQRPGRTVTQSA